MEEEEVANSACAAATLFVIRAVLLLVLRFLSASIFALSITSSKVAGLAPNFLCCWLNEVSQEEKAGPNPLIKWLMVRGSLAVTLMLISFNLAIAEVKASIYSVTLL